MSGKGKFPRAVALEVARELCRWLEPDCERLICAGSLRRRKLEVGDVELVFIPKLRTVPLDMFTSGTESRVDVLLGRLLAEGVISKRRNKAGGVAWGEKNKLAVHVASGVPVDLFATTAAAWFNDLVCRTGGAESNTAIAAAAQRKGWKWNPYGPGFTDAAGEIVAVTSEREVFELVGLPYSEPWERA